jgi:hypothetical protein
MSKTCRASAELGREGDGREDIQEEEEGGEGQKGGQNPLSVDKNVSWDNFEGSSQPAQGAERKKISMRAVTCRPKEKGQCRLSRQPMNFERQWQFSRNPTT